MIAAFPLQSQLFMNDALASSFSPKRAFMSKENRLYQEGAGGGSKRQKCVEPSSSDMFAGPGVSQNSDWLEERENIAVGRNPRFKMPLVRSTPTSLWQITPKENTDPRVEVKPCKKTTLALGPIGSERRNFSFNSRNTNMQADVESRKLEPEPQRDSFTWAGSGPESSMDLLTSPLSLISQAKTISRPVIKPLRPTLGPHRHSFTDSYPSSSSFSSSYTYPAYLSVPTTGVVIDPEPVESPPMTITQFASVLRDIRKKNPYAPKMPSMLNPLRASAPFMYHTGVEPNTKNPYSNLTWNFQKRRNVMRSRSRCADDSNRRLREHAYVANGDCHHCTFCKRDTLCKRLLAVRYWRLEDEAEAAATVIQSVPRDVGDSDFSDEEQDEDGDVRMGVRSVEMNKTVDVIMDFSASDVLDITGNLAQELREQNAKTRTFNGRDRDRVARVRDRHSLLIPRVGSHQDQQLAIGSASENSDCCRRGGRDASDLGDWVPSSPILKDLDSFPEEDEFCDGGFIDI